MLAGFAAALATVPLFGGRLSGLAALPLRRRWTIAAAIVVQVVLMGVLPTRLPLAAAAVAHLASYALALVFVVANRRIPGMAVLVAGGLANLIVIGANGGVMPADPAALARAGLTPPAEGFANSTTLDGARLAFLGDTMAIPSGFPLANVFSIGDVMLVAGGAVVAHRAGGSRLPRLPRLPRRRRRDGLRTVVPGGPEPAVAPQIEARWLRSGRWRPATRVWIDSATRGR
jgi:hypothetical protein